MTAQTTLRHPPWHLASLALAWAWASLGSPAVAQEGEAGTQRLEVRVVELAGGRAYVTPGEEAGLRRHDRVRFGKRSLRVVAASAQSALIEVGAAKLRVGQRGLARVRPASDDEVKRLPKPEALARFSGQWPRARLPARDQKPRPIPLGQALVDQGQSELTLWLGGAARAPLSGPAEAIGSGRLRARLRSEPIAALPLFFEVDAAAQKWFAENLDARDGSDSRPPLWVYSLHARYGAAAGTYGAAGRLRYAAQSLGPMDGARLSAPLGAGLSLSAFGGGVPQPLDGSPDFSTQRFGAELLYDNVESELRPRVSLTAHGSHFEDRLDERRLQLRLDLEPGAFHVGGYAQASLFDEDNPWNAAPQELSAAGARGGARLGPVRLGARFDMQRPERSRWLASFFPQDALCIALPAPPSDIAESCHGDEARYLAQADIGLHFERVALRLAFTGSQTKFLPSEQLGALLHLRWLEPLRATGLDASLVVSEGSLMRSAAFTLAPSLSLGATTELSLRYRPAIARYTADVGYFIEHGLGTGLRLMPTADIDFSIDADFVTGRDVDMVLIQALCSARL
ncbi:MAG: hypothetical protein OEZ06_11090 [Myxococcales bacterium]|nr:hypothetical protein [Myxococcales bacterium]